jgi:hypothetical protein
MDQDAVKKTLSSIRATKKDFTVIFSGKKKNTVNGLYFPATCEIVLHNRNFENDNALLFTAIHEYAHHIDSTEYAGCKGGARAHTTRFWSIFHDLLDIAEKKKIYRGPDSIAELADLTKSIEALIEESGRVLKKIGAALIEADEILKRNDGRLEDYLMRKLHQSMAWAKAAMSSSAYGLNEKIGTKNLEYVSTIRDPERRAEVENGLLTNKTLAQVKINAGSVSEPEDIVERLKKEVARIEKTIDSLSRRRDEVKKELSLQLKLDL